jgi:hypothetical protein
VTIDPPQRQSQLQIRRTACTVGTESMRALVVIAIIPLHAPRKPDGVRHSIPDTRYTYIRVQEPRNSEHRPRNTLKIRISEFATQTSLVGFNIASSRRVKISLIYHSSFL